MGVGEENQQNGSLNHSYDIFPLKSHAAETRVTSWSEICTSYYLAHELLLNKIRAVKIRALGEGKNLIISLAFTLKD